MVSRIKFHSTQPITINYFFLFYCYYKLRANLLPKFVDIAEYQHQW